jgi:hypothetical protein
MEAGGHHGPRTLSPVGNHGCAAQALHFGRGTYPLHDGSAEAIRAAHLAAVHDSKAEQKVSAAFDHVGVE